jgi:putative membrane-bound dehydrogenase-like protein
MHRNVGPLAVPLILAFQAGMLAQADKPAAHGRPSELRFPPLELPEGFTATLFACDPLIEYPSVLALGPRASSIFIAHDYMTGLGTEIVRRDEVRLVEDTDGDGYADRSAVFAAGLNSIQGLTWHDGRVYAMHAPFLTLLRDADGDGAAEERRDLLAGLGWPPEKCPDRLHCANGVTAGHDGWLYLAVGDRGCDVARPEGDRLVLEGGGIIRCRPDGRDLHVFATGLRNIYDVALDEELNVFVRDNENDGGSYKVRVYHSFLGADHGYPYLYEERPEEALPPLADLGLGSSAGGACYLETAFPADYRGDVFFCEWGRSVVRYRRARAGAGFAAMKEIEFASGGDADPYGFKPTDVIADRDGSLLVADWGDGQRPKRGRGRVYRIRHREQGPPIAAPPRDRSLAAWIDQLGAENQHARLEAQAAIEARGEEGRAALAGALAAGRAPVLARLHGVWILARGEGRDRLDALFRLAGGDPDPRVRAQAVRAVADAGDPVLREHRLDSGRGDPDLARRLAAIGRDEDARVRLEVLIALGRLRWPEAPAWLRETARELDPAMAHAVLQLLRRAGNWPAVIALLDEPDASPLRRLALQAAGGAAVPAVAEALITRLAKDRDAARRRQYADALARIHGRPGPWTYWGFRPGPRPPSSVVWEWSEPIARALNAALADPDRGVRAIALERMRREKVPLESGAAARWLREESDPDRVASILEALGDAPAGEARDAAGAVAAGIDHTAANRIAALRLFARAAAPGEILALAEALEDSPVLAEAIRLLGARRAPGSAALLGRGLASLLPEVRIAALDALADPGEREAGPRVLPLLADRDPGVRRAAASTLGRLEVREAAAALIESAVHADAELRRRSLEALGRLREPRALPLALAALKDHETQLAGLECLAGVGGPDQAGAIVELAAKSRAVEVLAASVRALESWGARDEARRPALDLAAARVQGASGIVLRWRARTVPLARAAEAVAGVSSPDIPLSGAWRTLLAGGPESSVTLPAAIDEEGDAAFLACADLHVEGETPVEVLASSGGSLGVWLNGRQVFHRREASAFRPDADRFDADLARGPNRLVVEVAAGEPPQLHLRFRRRGSTAERDRLIRLVLTTTGDAESGRAVLGNVERSACLKCHRLAGEGGKIGPDLTGVGRRFSRIHLIESILEPSRTIADSFQGHVVKLEDGRIVVGVHVAETAETLTLGDQEGKTHVLEKARILEREPVETSIMPEGLEKALTEKEIVDLIAFLEAER